MSQAERGVLFDCIAALDPDQVAPVVPAEIGGAAGWLISDGVIARKILTQGVGVKSRPAQSQTKLGGIGARQDETVRSLKRSLLRAFGSLADQEAPLLEHVTAELDKLSRTRLCGLTEALTSATLTLIAGTSPGAVDSTVVRDHAMASWRSIEDTSSPLQGIDPFHDYIRSLLTNGQSTFLTSLTSEGWSLDDIAAELRAMVLAGWGSTAAAITSAISLGVAGRLGEPFVLDEVLRLYPPSFMIGRTTTATSRDLPFRRGDLLLISPWVIHRSNRGWSDPLTFDPERWQRHSEGPPWFMPFGLGPRRCPASRFARAQAQAAGSHLRDAPAPPKPTIGLMENRSPALGPPEAFTAK